MDVSWIGKGQLGEGLFFEANFNCAYSHAFFFSFSLVSGLINERVTINYLKVKNYSSFSKSFMWNNSFWFQLLAENWLALFCLFFFCCAHLFFTLFLSERAEEKIFLLSKINVLYLKRERKKERWWWLQWFFVFLMWWLHLKCFFLRRCKEDDKDKKERERERKM